MVQIPMRSSTSEFIHDARIPSPVQEVDHPLLRQYGVSLFIKRDDLIHEQVSGNKYRKIKYNLLDAQVIGFGGMEEVRFREPVVPGDRLVIAVERVRVRPKAMIVCRFQGLVRDSIVVDGVIKGVPLPPDYLVPASAGASRAGGGATG